MYLFCYVDKRASWLYGYFPGRNKLITGMFKVKLWLHDCVKVINIDKGGSRRKRSSRPILACFDLSVLQNHKSYGMKKLFSYFLHFVFRLGFYMPILLMAGNSQ
jgi:hypothetical protein